jgi:hypothetical protein
MGVIGGVSREIEAGYGGMGTNRHGHGGKDEKHRRRRFFEWRRQGDDREGAWMSFCSCGHNG